MLLEIKGINQRFGDNDILKDINMEIKQGETFVIIGPTGSGKTTLLRLIGLLDKPVSGRIYFKGQEMPDSARARLALRRRMAMVSQKPAVFNTTVYNNVAYGLRIRKEKGAGLRDKVTNALETVGLAGYEKRNARSLSGGETQRVALARAMVLQPELLLLDEPTANLDPVSTANVEKLIAQVIRKLDTTVIMTTHDMFQGQRLAERMGVIVAGEMQQTGNPREIFGLPQSRDIAEFVGVENILEGTIKSNDGGVITVGINGAEIQAISDLDPGVNVYACIRPEEIVLARKTDKTSARNTYAAEITRIVSFAPLAHVHMDCGFPLVALITVKSAEEMGLQIGTPVYAYFKATGVHIIPR
ncbi:MAG: ABC transporter ATP-binding protein [Dehalococcoidia bacterium]|nr:MAG: ABC transporter ATP-binding protein [Dehalococcoidia bacterium]